MSDKDVFVIKRHIVIKLEIGHGKKEIMATSSCLLMSTLLLHMSCNASVYPLAAHFIKGVKW